MKWDIKVYVIILLCIAVLSCQTTPTQSNHHNNPAERPPSKIDQGSALAHYISSLVYHRRGDVENAKKELEKVVELDPDSLVPLIRLLRLYFLTEQYEPAVECINKAIAKESSIPALYLLRGELYHRLGNIDEAIASFQKAIELNPNDVLGYSALLELQENTNDLVSAIEIYQKMIERRPDSALLYYQLGLTYARIKNNPSAIESLEKALQLDPRMIRAYYILALLYIDENKITEAMHSLELYHQRKPEDEKAQEVLLGIYTRLGEMTKAKIIADRLVQSPSISPIQKLLIAFFYLKNNECYRTLSLLPVIEYPLISKLLTGLAQKSINDEQYKETLSTIDMFVDGVDKECNDFLNPMWSNYGNGIVHQWWGTQIASLADEFSSLALKLTWSRILILAEREQEAIQVLSPLVETYKRNLWLHYYLAIAYDKLKQFEHTEKHLKICLELDPENAEILNFLGYLYADHNVNISEAEQLIRRALKIDPENPYYLDSLGWVYYRQGNAEKAIEYIRKAIYKMDTDDAVLRDHLGDAYLLQGNLERAISEWERALVLDPKNEQIKEKINKYKNKLEKKKTTPIK